MLYGFAAAGLRPVTATNRMATKPVPNFFVEKMFLIVALEHLRGSYFVCHGMENLDY